jgi:carbonic anhydrase
MKKLLNGIIEFRKKHLTEYRQKYATLALGQSPDSLFIACSDSRVVPNVFASTDPGDVFVLRNIGNLISPCNAHHEHDGESSAAAIEFSLHNLTISDIIVCGHSECAAIQAVINCRHDVESPQLRAWLRHAEPAYKKYQQGIRINPGLAIHNEVSQLNVLQQMEHLKTYPEIKQRIADNTLRLHGWWFDLATADVYTYVETIGKFVIIDEQFI